MLTRYHLTLSAVLLSLSVSAMADITLNAGADIDMTGSTGSTIIFDDGTAATNVNIKLDMGTRTPIILIGLALGKKSVSPNSPWQKS